jgi:hypothetical protein
LIRPPLVARNAAECDPHVLNAVRRHVTGCAGHRPITRQPHVVKPPARGEREPEWVASAGSSDRCRFRAGPAGVVAMGSRARETRRLQSDLRQPLAARQPQAARSRTPGDFERTSSVPGQSNTRHQTGEWIPVLVAAVRSQPTLLKGFGADAARAAANRKTSRERHSSAARMAEREGFEPPEPFRVQRFSRPPP